MARKFTEEQLSRILSEAAVDGLEHGGTCGWRAWAWCDDVPRACVNQIAFNEEDAGVAGTLWPKASRWFDDLPRGSDFAVRISPEGLLAALEKAGLA